MIGAAGAAYRVDGHWHPEPYGDDKDALMQEIRRRPKSKYCRNHFDLYARTPWSEGLELWATARGLCLHNERSHTGGQCDPFAIEGLDGIASCMWRDADQRLWFAGRRLWCLEGGRAVDAIPDAPFMDDTEVADLLPIADGLLLALGRRGLLTVPKERIASACTSP